MTLCFLPCRYQASQSDYAQYFHFLCFLFVLMSFGKRIKSSKFESSFKWFEPFINLVSSIENSRKYEFYMRKKKWRDKRERIPLHSVRFNDFCIRQTIRLHSSNFYFSPLKSNALTWSVLVAISMAIVSIFPPFLLRANVDGILAIFTEKPWTFHCCDNVIMCNSFHSHCERAWREHRSMNDYE